MKTCNGPCGKERPNSDFYIKRYKNGSIGLRSYCKECSTAARDAWRKSSSKDNERNKAYNRRNARRIRGMKLTKYWPGSSWEEALDNFDKLMLLQNNVCALCGNLGHPTKGLHIDHCHNTNKVRGLLCYNCNSGLGRFKDDTRVLMEAVTYIIKHRDNK